VALIPSHCLAHGEQVLVLPISNLIALIAFLGFVFFWRERAVLKLCFFALFCVGVALSWILPLLPHTVGELARFSVFHIALIGFGVPAAVTVFGYVLIRLFRRGEKPDA